MVQINITYEGDLHCVAEHVPSGTTLTTDAPKDNQGKGESFSPTDLVATALGTCIMSVMGIAAREMQVDLRGTKVTVNKEMIATPARRIGRLLVVVEVPLVLDEASKQKLAAIAESCPVKQSMHPDLQMPIEFRWA
jgi:putative redox protein